jgi:hypothetical protein
MPNYKLPEIFNRKIKTIQSGGNNPNQDVLLDSVLDNAKRIVNDTNSDDVQKKE